MNFLAIDTSTDNISVCVKRGGKVAADFNRRIKFGASKLVTFIKQELEAADLELCDIDAFVIGKGPGSFMGLRISFSVVKAFAVALNKPVIAVESFFSCAYPLKQSQKDIAVISDARRGLLYLSLFKHKKGGIRKEGKARLVKIDGALRFSKKYIFTAFEPELKKRLLRLNPKCAVYRRDVYPQAKYLIPEAERLCRKRRFTALDNLNPLYLHPRTCQIRR